MGYMWAIHLSLFTYLLTTSVSGQVPGYPSYYPAGTQVINYPDTAALLGTPDKKSVTALLGRITSDSKT